MMTPIDYSKVISLFAAYVARFSSEMTARQKELCGEMTTKLTTLRDVSDEIIATTNQAFALQDFGVDENDVINVFGMKLKLNRADPNVPIAIGGAVKAYMEGSDRPESEDVKAVERTLRRRAEEFYTNAHRITHITDSLPALGAFRASAVRIVRNQLMEHPEGSSSGVTHDTFSYDMQIGPIMKGLRVGDQLQHRDAGFKPNSDEFIGNLERALENALSPVASS